jgi:hypothetical protein
MTPAAYRIRTMTPAEVALAIDWAAEEGWNPGRHDAASFRVADPEGFLVGVLDGEPIASISVVRYGATFGFLGLYIVRREHRGNGHGWRLWQAGMAFLAGRSVGLDGVVAQQDNYRKSGFVPAWRNVRYAGLARAADAPDAHVVDATTLPFAALAAYDAPFFPDDRTAFLRQWLAQPEAFPLAYVSEGRIEGYGVVRPCRSGWKIGPLFADSAAIAEALIASLSARLPAGTPLFLDVPEPNAAAVALAQRQGMSPAFETARMYTGAAPALPLARLFGVTTFELG